MKLSLVPQGKEKIECKDIMSDCLVGGNIFGSINLLWHFLTNNCCILNDGFNVFVLLNIKFCWFASSFV